MDTTSDVYGQSKGGGQPPLICWLLLPSYWELSCQLCLDGRCGGLGYLRWWKWVTGWAEDRNESLSTSLCFCLTLSFCREGTVSRLGFGSRCSIIKCVVSNELMLIVELDGLKGLFQAKWCYDSVTWLELCEAWGANPCGRSTGDGLKCNIGHGGKWFSCWWAGVWEGHSLSRVKNTEGCCFCVNWPIKCKSWT